MCPPILNDNDFSADFMIRVRKNNRKGIKEREFYLPEDGKLSFTRTESEVKLDWGKITWSNYQGSIIDTDKGITYTVIATKDDRARLDSECVLRKEVAAKYVMANF